MDIHRLLDRIDDESDDCHEPEYRNTPFTRKIEKPDLLIWAASMGYVQFVKSLSKSVDEPCRYRALCIASMKGNEACVEVLLPLTNPMADSSKALRLAMRHGHLECARLLLPFSDVVEAIRVLESRNLGFQAELLRRLVKEGVVHDV